jgi:hypothetical protein
MLKLQSENIIIDIPDLNQFRIGDRVVADECADCDRHEGIVIGIELQRVYGSNYLRPSITLLHDGYMTDGFKPMHLRKIDAAEAATEIEALRRENQELRAAVIEECAKVAMETPLSTLTSTSAPGDQDIHRLTFEVAATSQRSAIASSIRALTMSDIHREQLDRPRREAE